MVKKIFSWTNIRLTLMLALVIFLYAFTGGRNQQRKLQKTEVVFSNNSQLFVNHEAVNKLLIENKSDPKTIRKLEVDLNKLEKSVNQNPMIEKSEVYLTVDGTLKAIVTQKTPVARVFHENSSFYIDYNGNTMPLSELHSARVPLVWGEIAEKSKTKITEILKQIHDDGFLSKNITGIKILPNGDLVMQNRNHEFEIMFGKPINAERKFKNYKAFYQKEGNNPLLDRYKRINLKFTQQVVCTK